MKNDQSRYDDDSLISRRLGQMCTSARALQVGSCRLILVIATIFCDSLFASAQNNAVVPAKPATSGKEQSPSDLSDKLQDFHSQAIKERDAKNFAQVDVLRLKRLDFLRKSTVNSPWTAGCKAIDEADGLIKQMKYQLACAKLKEAWIAFESMPAGETVFGDIAMKLFEAVQAAKAVYPDATAETGVSIETLCASVRRAADDDPCQVEALAIDAFLTEPNPDESFQPAELRPSLRLRNKRLIDISYSKERDKHPMPWHAPAEFLKAKSSSFVLDDLSYYERFLDPRSRLQGIDRNNEPFSVVMGGAILINAPNVEGTTSLCVAEYRPDQRRWLRVRPLILTVGPIAGKDESWRIDKASIAASIPSLLADIDEQRRLGFAAEVLATADGLKLEDRVKRDIVQRIFASRADYRKALKDPEFKRALKLIDFKQAMETLVKGYENYLASVPDDSDLGNVAITRSRALLADWEQYAALKNVYAGLPPAGQAPNGQSPAGQVPASQPASSQAPFTIASANGLQSLVDFLAKDDFRAAEHAAAVPEAAEDGSGATAEDSEEPKARAKPKGRGRATTPNKKGDSGAPEADDEEKTDTKPAGATEEETNPFDSQPDKAVPLAPSYPALRSRLANLVPDYDIMCFYSEMERESAVLDEFVKSISQQPAGDANRSQALATLKRSLAEYKQAKTKAGDNSITLDLLLATRDSLADMSDSMTQLGVDSVQSRFLSTFLQRCDSIVRSVKIERDIFTMWGTLKRVHSWTIGRNIWAVYELPKALTNATVADWIDYSRTVSFDIDELKSIAESTSRTTIPESRMVSVRDDLTSEDNPLVFSSKGKRVLRLTGDVSQRVISILLSVDQDTEKDFGPAVIDGGDGQSFLWIHDSGNRSKAGIVINATSPAEMVINYPGVDGHVPLAIPQERFGSVRYLIDRRGNRIVKSDGPAVPKSPFYAMTSSAGVALTDPAVNYRIQDSLDLDRNIMNSFLPDLMLYNPSLPSWQLYRQEFMRGRPAPDWVPDLRWSVPRRPFR